VGKLIRFVAGAAIGAAVGAAGAMLFAPQSGKDLQTMVTSRRQQALAAGRAAMEAREREMRADLQARQDAQQIKRQALRG
jgi:gas vesicle protein